MKKYYLIALLLVVIILSGCTNYDEALGNHQSILIDVMEDVRNNSQKIEELENKLVCNGIVENSDRDLCVGIQNITVSVNQSKELFECIGNGEGYCTCIEKYASCTLDICDIPEEYRDDFDPKCNNQ